MGAGAAHRGVRELAVAQKSFGVIGTRASIFSLLSPVIILSVLANLALNINWASQSTEHTRLEISSLDCKHSRNASQDSFTTCLGSAFVYTWPQICNGPINDSACASHLVVGARWLISSRAS